MQMPTSPVNPSPTTVWRDPAADPDLRLDALLADMTLGEKVAQLGSIWLGFDAVTGEVAPMQNALSQRVSLASGGSERSGHLTRVFGTRPTRPARVFNGSGSCSATLVERPGWAFRPSCTRSA